MMRLITIVALVLSLSACKPFEAAWRATSAVKAAATITDKAIATAAVNAHNACVKAHGSATMSYRACIEAAPAYKALQRWRSYGKPTINAALIGTVTGLQIAERAKAKEFDWKAAIKPAACALAKMVGEFGALLPPSVRSAIALVKVVSCE